MNIEEIRDRIAQDVAMVTEHKETLGTILVEPQQETFESMRGDEKPLWIIAKKEEYYITFDDMSTQYGIAFRNIIGTMVYLGNDGSIIDAYERLISREEESAPAPQEKPPAKKVSEKPRSAVPFRKNNDRKPDWKSKRRG